MFVFYLILVASYGMQHPIGMGRGFPNYGAMGGAAAGAATGYAGPPGPAPAQGYLYGMCTPILINVVG